MSCQMEKHDGWWMCKEAVSSTPLGFRLISPPSLNIAKRSEGGGRINASASQSGTDCWVSAAETSRELSPFPGNRLVPPRFCSCMRVRTTAASTEFHEKHIGYGVSLGRCRKSVYLVVHVNCADPCATTKASGQLCGSRPLCCLPISAPSIWLTTLVTSD